MHASLFLMPEMFYLLFRINCFINVTYLHPVGFVNNLTSKLIK
jgi:hypothetical protein